MAMPQTYLGALHVHTDRSDGAGTLEDVLGAARGAGLHFVVLTDHGTRGYAEEAAEGWNQGVLVLAGEEVTTPQGHFLVFETRSSIGKVATLEEALQETRAQCGQAVSIHHQLEHPRLPPPIPLDRADLMEVWSFMDEFLSHTSGKTIMRQSLRPEKQINGPSRRVLWRWDRELERRMIPAVCGLNVHQRKHPLLDWRVFFPYHVAFQSLCLAVQMPDLPAVSTRAVDLLWHAIRSGRSYLVNRSVGPEKPFLFEYIPPKAGARARQMGEDVPYQAGGRFHILVPEEAELVLRHNGQPLFWGTAKEFTFPGSGPGSYRLEVFLHRRLWILGNPIRLTDDDGVVQPTVSDVT